MNMEFIARAARINGRSIEEQMRVERNEIARENAREEAAREAAAAMAQHDCCVDCTAARL